MPNKILNGLFLSISLGVASLINIRDTVQSQTSQRSSGPNVNDRGGPSRTAKRKAAKKKPQAKPTPPRRKQSDPKTNDSAISLMASATPTPTPTPTPAPPPVRGPNPSDRGGASTAGDATPKVRAAAEQSAKAARVFNQIMESREKSIPRDLLDRAEAVAVFPGVLKGGFIVGGRGGSGVISRRVPGGWSAPAFFELGGGSVGLQIGVASSDYILLFMNPDAVESLLQDRFEIGGEGSAAAGPVGRSASASTDVRLNAQILSYSRSKGAFAGLELKGVVIKPNNEVNMRVYGINARDILSRASKFSFANTPEGVRAFPATLSRYSTRR